MPLNPTARRAWEALKSAGGTGLDVLAAPGKGAAATLRYATTGEEPRLEPGSSWRIAGPGLGEMAAQGYGMAGDVLGKELYPETEGLDTSGATQMAEAIMTVPFAFATEGVGQGEALSSAFRVPAVIRARNTPLGKLLNSGEATVAAPPRGPLNVSLRGRVAPSPPQPRIRLEAEPPPRLFEQGTWQDDFMQTGAKPKVEQEILPYPKPEPVDWSDALPPPPKVTPTLDRAMEFGAHAAGSLAHAEDAGRGAAAMRAALGPGTMADDETQAAAKLAALARFYYRAAQQSVPTLATTDDMLRTSVRTSPVARANTYIPPHAALGSTVPTARQAYEAAQRSEEEARR